ncbi:glycoside hydrolase family 31 protein [Pisolithus orientalis]|uniref:glycoside hydrolase family 31 protein n=1 Tax=Pisolithus orientalis TaxID=936130 RepID=UPI002225B086|nr:glycoside hydrolase family 31 protein [Pisolithus orientalis]KAI5991745.1 glycoside hydrolase family 31 protein [Pisolithus orientalis]
MLRPLALSLVSTALLVSASRPAQVVRDIAFSKNVSHCPGYTLTSLAELQHGLSAQLQLAGPACNAFGSDIANLTLEVTYQSQSTIRVAIFDTAEDQFRIPTSIIPPPPLPTKSLINDSDLVFNYDPSPFAFWITRRSDPDAMPIFDTRISSLPTTPIPPFNASDPSTAFDGFPLVFEDQYLQITSALPLGTNIYGLGEVIASSGFRRDIGTGGGSGTIQTHWNRDAADPIDENIYGSHPIYLEHRYNETTGKATASGALLLSASGSDILLQTPPSSPVSLIQYRMLGGTFDFHFFSGPSDVDVIAQYGAVSGYPFMPPAWGFGFHLCRWGYHDVNDDIANVEAMREAGIPLEVQWNDIDLYHAFRDFTTDPVSFPTDEVRSFIENLTTNHQHYIPIVDAGIALTVNDTDVYDPFTRGSEMNVFMKNPDGSLYIGQVWPGYTAFPDWFSDNAVEWWTEALMNWSANGGVEFSGIWLDMNEVSSFCGYSCGTGANFSALAPLSVVNITVVGYPECYNETVSGPSGNMTVNGTPTYSCSDMSGSRASVVVRTNTRTVTSARRSVGTGIGAGGETGINVTYPPYAIHNSFGALSVNTVATNATHAGGYLELDVHNLFGTMEAHATYLALQKVRPGKRPFVIGRSTFVSQGRWAGHWLGDNYSKWEYMYLNIQGVLQFQIYQIPMVGADTCGFNGNTNEELCNRWMQLSAFMPFYRNHNMYAALPQEPYRWDSVADASKIAIRARYSLLPYWYTLFANASTAGLPPIRALFYEFPDEPELFTVDRQWLVGKDILVTPVLEPGQTTVQGILPGRGDVIWRDWWTHVPVSVSPTNTSNQSATVTLQAPISHINVHIRGGSILLLYDQPGYTIYETMNGPYALLVSLDGDGQAWGDAFVDAGDGEFDAMGGTGSSSNSTLARRLNFEVCGGSLRVKTQWGAYNIEQKVETITILGVGKEPDSVVVQGEVVNGWVYNGGIGELVVAGAEVNLNGDVEVSWTY